MKPQFHHVGLIGKFLQSNNLQQASHSEGTPPEIMLAVAECLERNGCQVAMEFRAAEMTGLNARYPSLEMVEIGEQCDLAVVVGGDGTMLGAARTLAPAKVPLIGINQGRLGFITDIPLGRICETLPPMLRGEYIEDHRSMMLGQVKRGESTVFEAIAFNDVVINRGSTAGMVELRIEVDGHFVSNQRADGLIVASPTGSTAYALSAGGPMLHPSLRGWVMVPIAPHTLSNRPIVLSDSEEIAIEVVGGRDISANFDMQSIAKLLHGDRILVTRAEHSVRFLHPRGWSYFATLRKKLRWNEGGS